MRRAPKLERPVALAHLGIYPSIEPLEQFLQSVDSDSTGGWFGRGDVGGVGAADEGIPDVFFQQQGLEKNVEVALAWLPALCEMPPAHSMLRTSRLTMLGGFVLATC